MDKTKFSVNFKKNNFRKTQTTILYSHGNATDIGGMIHFLAKIYEHLGVNVLHYDYIGYGLVKETYGLPNEDTTYESIEAAHQVFFFLSFFLVFIRSRNSKQRYYCFWNVSRFRTNMSFSFKRTRITRCCFRVSFCFLYSCCY